MNEREGQVEGVSSQEMFLQSPLVPTCYRSARANL